MMPIVRLGSLGEAVTTLQAALNRWSGSSAMLFVDGFFGLRTNSKVREYQAAHDLAPDGIVGPVTWESLRPLVEDMLGIAGAESAADATPPATSTRVRPHVPAASRSRARSSRAWTATHSARREAMTARARRA